MTAARDDVQGSEVRIILAMRSSSGGIASQRSPVIDLSIFIDRDAKVVSGCDIDNLWSCDRVSVNVLEAGDLGRNAVAAASAELVKVVVAAPSVNLVAKSSNRVGSPGLDLVEIVVADADRRVANARSGVVRRLEKVSGAGGSGEEDRRRRDDQSSVIDWVDSRNWFLRLLHYPLKLLAGFPIPRTKLGCSCDE